MDKRKFNLIIGLSVLAIILIIAVISFMHNTNNTLPANKVKEIQYLSNPTLPPICGGIATSEWYLYSANEQGPFSNETVGMCGISSSASCNFPMGYYGC